MVAKMPLLMSSRMMSATLTVRSSASSLTVIVAGQLDRATLARVDRLDLGSGTPPSRRGGLRGPRRPRVPLLLLATGSSFDGVVGSCGPRGRCSRGAPWGPGLERPAEGALGVGDGQTRRRPADVCAAAGQPAGLVGDDRPVRASGRCGRARAWAGAVRHATHVRVGTGRGASRARAADAGPATTPPPRWRLAVVLGGALGLVGAASA